MGFLLLASAPGEDPERMLPLLMPRRPRGEAVEQARKQGDEFNVNVDTFRTSIVRRQSVPVRPSSHVDGRFAPAEQLLDGFYIDTHQANGPSVGQHAPLHEVPQFHPPRAFRDSMDSVFTASSEGASMSMPHNIENLMSEEDQRKLYYARQARSSNSVSVMAESEGSGENVEYKFDPRYDISWPTEPPPILSVPGVSGLNAMHDLHPRIIRHIPLEGVIETDTPRNTWLQRTSNTSQSSLQPSDSMV